MARRRLITPLAQWPDPPERGGAQHGIGDNQGPTLDDIDAELCNRDPHEFIRTGWTPAGIDPSPFVDNWHIGVICEHLQAVMMGQILRLCFKLPPRHMKPVAETEPVLEKTRGKIPLSAVEVGDLILTHRGRFQRVSAVHLQGVLPCVAVETFRGRRVVAAPDHPFLTARGWVLAGNLVVGDVVGAPVPPDCGTATITPEEARLLGYIVGDGNVTHGILTISNIDETMLADVEACIASKGWSSHRKKDTRNKTITIRVSDPSEKRGPRLGRVREWLGTHGLDGASSYTKRVPPAVNAASNALIAQFIGAYWACDGCFAKRGYLRGGAERTDVAMFATTVSDDLACDLLHLLQRLGIGARVRRRERPLATKRQPGGIYRYCTLDITSMDEAAKFAERVPIRHAKAASLAAYRRVLFDRPMIEDKVTSVSAAQSEACRCLTVEEDSSFTAGDLAVHNTLGLTAFVPYVWAQKPKIGTWAGPATRFIFGSYAQQLSFRDSDATRRILGSPWYQRLYGDRFKITTNRTTRIVNDKGGYRIPASVGGALTGEGFDIGVIDDPLKALDAFSIVKRMRAAEWYDGTWFSRRNEPKRSAIILNAQRIAEDDVTGHVLKREAPEWTVVCLPARYDPTHPYVYAKDPRKTAGEPLWKGRFDDADLKQLEQTMGPHTAAAQLQQRPTPRHGGIIDSSWFNLWPHAREFPKFEFVVQCYDTAFEEDDKNELTGDPDFTVCHTWGVFKVDDLPRSAVLLNRWAARLAYPDLRTKAVEWARMGWPPSEDPKAIKQRAAKIIVEKKASGISLIQDLARLRLPVEPYDPRGDKLLRLHLGSPMVKKGRIWLPESKQRPDNPVRWCDPMIEQVCTFRGEGTIPHDDEVDAFSMFLRYMIDLEVLTANSDRLMSESEEMYGEDEAALIRRQSQKKRRNPYG